MKTVAIVVAILIILLVVALVVLAARRNQRRAALRERFGPEYDLAVRRGKDRRAVEQHLETLSQQRDTLEIRDVATEEYDRYAAQWAGVQGRFVDDPGQAVADADTLVNAVLRSRGYPVESFDDRAALVATDHRDVVAGYRSAHDAYAEHLQSGHTDTERLRQAFLSYREVFGRLNRTGGDHPAVEAAPAVAAAPGPAQAPPAEPPAVSAQAPRTTPPDAPPAPPAEAADSEPAVSAQAPPAEPADAPPAPPAEAADSEPADSEPAEAPSAEDPPADRGPAKHRA
ncbi:MAG: hypothetical protein ACXV1K_01275 [Kineosporiaceae bacterium]